MPACTRGFRLWNTGAGRIRQSCTQCPSTSEAALRTGYGMMRLLAIWRRSIFSPQRSDSGNRRSPLFHTIPLISAASYPNPMDLRYRINITKIGTASASPASGWNGCSYGMFRSVNGFWTEAIPIASDIKTPHLCCLLLRSYSTLLPQAQKPAPLALAP